MPPVRDHIRAGGRPSCHDENCPDSCRNGVNAPSAWVGHHALMRQTKEVAVMPETLNGRQKIKAYLDANDISIASLATMYGMSKQDLSDYLAGRKKNPQANRVILKIISDFKLS